jgi:hypothetical protein
MGHAGTAYKLAQKEGTKQEREGEEGQEWVMTEVPSRMIVLAVSS